MIIEVNVVIGTSICVDIEDILVVTGVAGMFTQGNKVTLIPSSMSPIVALMLIILGEYFEANMM